MPLPPCRGMALIRLWSLQVHAAPGNSAPIWTTGEDSGTNTKVHLWYDSSGGNLELGWGSTFAKRWWYNGGFSFASGNWYFIAVTVQANGASRATHMWIGDGGVLADKVEECRGYPLEVTLRRLQM